MTEAEAKAVKIINDCTGGDGRINPGLMLMQLTALLAASRPGEGERDRIVGAMTDQIDKAYAKHGRRPWSRHEFYGVLREEVDELWDEIKRDTPMENVLKEALQVACVCIRYMETGDAYRGEHPQGLWAPASAAKGVGEQCSRNFPR